MKLIDLLHKINSKQLKQILFEFGENKDVDLHMKAFFELLTLSAKHCIYTINIEKVAAKPPTDPEEWNNKIIEAREYIKNNNVSDRDFKNIIAQSPLYTESDIKNIRELNSQWVPSYYYDVYGIKKGSKERWALEFLSWEQWLGMSIKSKCIKEYGELVVTCAILEEITFNGFSNEEQKNNSQIMIDRLQDTINENNLLNDPYDDDEDLENN